jgi:putative (di)nucleoside polyphosphate hydrolase
MLRAVMPDQSPSEPSPAGVPTVYRPNVAAILQRDDGSIFVAERIGIKGAWQFPQGGVDSGEDAETALFRELEEEIGVRKEHVTILSRRDGYRYAFTKGRLKYGVYGGQEQSYFLCRFSGTDADFNLDATDREFARWKWIMPAEFKGDWVPKFKRHVYRQVLLDFFAVDIGD